MENVKNELQALKKGLLKGSLHEIAKRTGKTYSAVVGVLNGRIKNDFIMKTIIEVAKENKEKQRNAENAIKELLED
jgi:hypothetical protein